MNIISLALRNLLRNRRRSLTTLIAMAIGATSILLFGGYSRNITYGLQTATVQRIGHLQIQHKDFFLYGSGNPAAFGIVDYQRIVDVVKKDPVLAPMLNVVTPTLQISGIAGNFSAGVSRTVMGAGTVVSDQNKMHQWNDYNSPQEQRPLSLIGSTGNSAVVGVGVARVLQLCDSLNIPDCAKPATVSASHAPSTPDDIAALSAMEASVPSRSKGAQIEMLATNVHGAPNVASLNVAKAELQNAKELDDIYIGLHLEQAQRLIYGNTKPQATAIVLQLQHTKQLAAAKTRLAELLATTFNGEPLEVHDFITLYPRYAQSIAMFNAIFGFIATLISAIVLFTVSNTMNMAVVERTVEIGTLRAIGLRRSGIRKLFVYEGFLLGVSGALSGIAISLLISAIINRSGLTWTPPGYVAKVPLNINVWGENGLLFGCAIGLIMVAVLSAFWPANRAAKMATVDALRHV